MLVTRIGLEIVATAFLSGISAALCQILTKSREAGHQ
jgi:hypothetical protein